MESIIFWKMPAKLQRGNGCDDDMEIVAKECSLGCVGEREEVVPVCASRDVNWLCAGERGSGPCLFQQGRELVVWGRERKWPLSVPAGT
jgi:hypothetical protein